MEVSSGGVALLGEGAGSPAPLSLETKTIALSDLDGGFVVKEFHQKGCRSVCLSDTQQKWIDFRMKFKGLHPGLDTQVLSREWGGFTVAVTEKSNQWGCFVALSVRNSEIRGHYIIIPGGSGGQCWVEFARWIYPVSGVWQNPNPFSSALRGGQMNYLAALTG